MFYAPTKQFTDEFYVKLSAVYDLKDLGTPDYVIGVRVVVSDERITLQQDRSLIGGLMYRYALITRPDVAVTESLRLRSLRWPVFELHRDKLLNGLTLGFPPRDPTEGGC